MPPTATRAASAGSVGVVFATSGPGALNLVTGLATAYMDSVPVVAITGQVPSTAIGTDSFQESDVIGSTMSVVKHSYLITRVEDIAPTIKEAFHIARTGRPGPVLIDFPKDLQAAVTAFNYPEGPVRRRSYPAPPRPDPAKLRQIAELIKGAKRPVILAGRGVLIAGAEEELAELAHQAHIPVGWTLLGTGAFPVTDPMALQMVGFMGAGYTNKAVCDADVLIMIGMRCDDRVTTRLDSFAPRVEHLVHIDIDPAEIGKNVVPHVSVVADAKVALRELNLLVEPKREHEWLTQIDQWKEEHPVRFTNHTGSAPAAAGARGDVRALRGRGDRARGRRPEPDLGGALVQLPQAGSVPQLRRDRDHGLRIPGVDGREARQPATRRCSASPVRAAS